MMKRSTYTDSTNSLTYCWTANLHWVYVKDITLQNLLMVNVCWRPKATCWCYSRAVGQGIDKVRLAPKLCTAPSTCLRATMIYFYCRRRPSRPHIKHLNSSPLCSHMPLFWETEPESCVWTLLLGQLGLWSFIYWHWQKACKTQWWKIAYAVAPQCSMWHIVFNNTTAHSPAPWKRHMKHDTQLFLPLN